MARWSKASLCHGKVTNVASKSRRRTRSDSASGDEARHRLQAGRLREHRIAQHRRREIELVGEQALQDGAQVGGRLEVAALVELLLASGPANRR